MEQWDNHSPWYLIKFRNLLLKLLNWKPCYYTLPIQSVENLCSPLSDKMSNKLKIRIKYSVQELQTHSLNLIQQMWLLSLKPSLLRTRTQIKMVKFKIIARNLFIQTKEGLLREARSAQKRRKKTESTKTLMRRLARSTTSMMQQASC